MHLKPSPSTHELHAIASEVSALNNITPGGGTIRQAIAGRGSGERATAQPSLAHSYKGAFLQQRTFASPQGQRAHWSFLNPFGPILSHGRESVHDCPPLYRHRGPWHLHTAKNDPSRRYYVSFVRPGGLLTAAAARTKLHFMPLVRPVPLT